jgi:phage replication initiation protein
MGGWRLEEKFSQKPPYGNTGAENTYRNGLRVLVDWVQATFPENISLREVFEILGVDQGVFIESQTGNLGYKKQLRFGHIAVLYDGNENMGIHLYMSGQGCREYENMKKNTWAELFAMILDVGGRFSRLDLAIDDFHGYFTIRQLKMKLARAHVRSRFKSVTEIRKRRIADGEVLGDSVYVGSEQSLVRIVFYAKDLEREQKGYTCPEDCVVWNRTEIRTRDERATKLADLLTHTDEHTAGYLASSILRNYIEFLEQSDDNNKSRWKLAKWWQDFLGKVQKQSLSEQAPDRTIERTDRWISHQVETGLSMIYIAYDRDLMKMMQYIESGMARLGEKEWAIIAQYKSRELTPEELKDFLEQEMNFVEYVKKKNEIKKSAKDTDSKKG